MPPDEFAIDPVLRYDAEDPGGPPSSFAPTSITFQMTAPFATDTGASEEKTLSFVDTNLLVNSSDVFRSAIGGYFYNDTDAENNYRTPPSFYKFLPISNPNGFIFSISSYKGANIQIPPMDSGFQSAIDASRLVGPTATMAYPDYKDLYAGGLGGYAWMPTAGFDYSQTAYSFLDTVLPFVQFVAHIEGDPLNPILQNPMQGNKFWELMFTGGEFDGEQVNSIYNGRVYDDHYFTTTHPYPIINKRYHFKSEEKNYIECSYEFNRYFRNYQQFNSTIESELLIPNWYALMMIGNRMDYVDSYRSAPRMAEFTFPSNIVSYYGFGADEDPLDVFTSRVYEAEPTTKLTHARERIGAIMTYIGTDKPALEKQYVKFRKYLDTDYVVSASYANIKTKEFHKSRFKNIIFNNYSAKENLNFNEDPYVQRRRCPYYNIIRFDAFQHGRYTEMIATNKYDTLFMRSLKEVFNGQAADTPTGYCQYLKNERFIDPLSNMGRKFGEDIEEKIASTSNVVNYRCVDLMKLVLHSHNTIKEEHEDFLVMDYKSLELDSAYDKKGVFRALNVRNSLRTMDDIVRTFYDPDGKAAFKINNINSLLNSQNDQILFNWKAFDELSPQSKENEVVAYRVEKIGGSGTGDSNTQNVIQNFWIFNGTENSEFNLIDSQVKFDQNYTYNIYAYYIVSGYKYKFSNLQLSRIISFVSKTSEEGETDAYEALRATGPGVDESYSDFLNRVSAYCIEFYDPLSGDTVIDLLEKAVYQPDLGESVDISSLANEDIRIAVSQRSYSPIGRDDSGFDDAAPLAALPPYIANFVTTIQPSLRVIEVPVMTKTYKIMDNPPNEVNVVPGVTLEGSNAQRLVFDLVYEPFNKNNKYPKLVDASRDSSKMINYLHGQDLLTTSKILDSFTADEPERATSVSPIRAIEVYRSDKKPLSFSDFEGTLIDTIPMMLSSEDTMYYKNKEFSYTTANFSDNIVSNKKYYYLFRAISENDMPGKVQTITEAEMVDDGGYRYALFNTLFEQDLFVDKTDRTSKTFKKLIQLKPNFSQIKMDTSNTTYLQDAIAAYREVKIGSAEEQIWDKTYKLRLTSKKTGKKIDLNITYCDPDQIIEPISESVLAELAAQELDFPYIA